MRVTDKARGVAQRLYKLTDREMLEAEKLFYRSSRGLCASARVIRERRK